MVTYFYIFEMKKIEADSSYTNFINFEIILW